MPRSRCNYFLERCEDDEKKHIQRNFDFETVQIVQNWWGYKWHIQRSDGLSLEGTPTFFDTMTEAVEYAAAAGIKITERK
jgi:hypothetical protein